MGYFKGGQLSPFPFWATGLRSSPTPSSRGPPTGGDGASMWPQLPLLPTCLLLSPEGVQRDSTIGEGFVYCMRNTKRI